MNAPWPKRNCYFHIAVTWHEKQVTLTSLWIRCSILGRCANKSKIGHIMTSQVQRKVTIACESHCGKITILFFGHRCDCDTCDISVILTSLRLAVLFRNVSREKCEGICPVRQSRMGCQNKIWFIVRFKKQIAKFLQKSYNIQHKVNIYSFFNFTFIMRNYFLWTGIVLSLYDRLGRADQWYVRTSHETAICW